MLRLNLQGFILGLLLGILFLLSGCGSAPEVSPSESLTEETVESSSPSVPASDVPAVNQSEAIQPKEVPSEPASEDVVAEPQRLPPPENAEPMPEPHQVWVDTKNSAVIVDGYVSLREGMLEMLACPVGTKEHESVVAVRSSAQVVHAALLAVGAKVGTPVEWNPEFKPPTGTEIKVEVRWLDSADKWQSLPAQQWVRDIKTGQPLAQPWVFAGSGFWKDEQTGQEYYMAEAGDFICVSNFTTATLDIPTESSQVTDGLLFEANTDKIPPLGTLVRLVLTPKLKGSADVSQ